jgi:hypothetical protein
MAWGAGVAAGLGLVVGTSGCLAVQTGVGRLSGSLSLQVSGHDGCYYRTDGSGVLCKTPARQRKYERSLLPTGGGDAGLSDDKNGSSYSAAADASPPRAVGGSAPRAADADTVAPDLPSFGSSPTAPPRLSNSSELLLFGGENHKVFLGCLTCSKYSTESVLNEYGPHGSPYQTDSIFNQYGTFGSAYSTHSPCSEYASDPPVIVDKRGRYYGRLTVNTYRDQTRIENVVAWLAGVCHR